MMKNTYTDDESFSDNYLYDEDYIKASRTKKAYNTRRKVDELMERKRNKHLYSDIRDSDWDRYD